MAKELRSVFNRAVVEEIASRIVPKARGFDRARFIAEIVADLPPLGIMDRAQRIACGLREHLPPDYPAALAILLDSLGEDDGTGGQEGFEGFRFLPFLNFVGAYGLEHPDLSLPALGRMTRYFSAEFDIRPYLIRYPERTLATLEQWAADPDWRVRRLVSEGARPRLPWGLRLKAFVADPAPVLKLIEILRADPSEVVRRSVANHLNDIAKDHPERVVDVARRWLKDGNEHTRWIVRHGLRTLVKQGNPDALRLLGYRGGAAVAVTAFKLRRRRLKLGEELAFEFALASRGARPVRLAIDYRVHHVRANGSLTPKTFKLASRTLAPGEMIRLERRHRIVPITTRRYYGGRHKIELIVNGKVLATAEFVLTV